MAGNTDGNVLNALKKINSVSFIDVKSDGGRTILFIPAWAAVIVIFLLALPLRSRRGKEG